MPTFTRRNHKIAVRGIADVQFRGVLGFGEVKPQTRAVAFEVSRAVVVYLHDDVRTLGQEIADTLRQHNRHKPGCPTANGSRTVKSGIPCLP